MGVFSRLKVGFGMAHRSGRVLRAHPRLFAFPLLGGVAGVAFVVTAGTGIQLLATVVVGGCGFVFGLLVGKALSGVAKTALYVYATERTAPEYFDDMDFGDLGGGSSSSGSFGDRFGSSGGGRI